VIRRSGIGRTLRPGRGVTPRLLALLLLHACTGETVTEVSISEVEVSPGTVSAVVGENVRLEAVVRDERGEVLARAVPVWSSDNPAIAEVDGTGLVQARSGGRAQIRATYEGVSGAAVVRVFAGPGIGASDENVEMLTAVGVGSPDPRNVFVTNAGTGALEGLAVETRHPTGAPRWLTASIGAATPPTSLTLTAAADDMPAGVYRADAVVSSSTPDVEPLEIRVTLRIAGVSVSHSGGGTVVTESGSTDTLTVVLESAPEENVVLDVASGDPGEATVAPARLTFTPQTWSTPQRITVTGVDDSTADGDQSTDVTVSADASASDRAYALVRPIVVSVTTEDDDTAELTVIESGGSTVVTEAGGTDVFTVALASSPGSNVVLDVTSADTGEVTVAPSRLTFTPGNWNVAQEVTVTGVDDAVNDGDQTTAVTISVDAAASDEAYDALPDHVVSVTTVDDDDGGVIVSETDGSTVVSEAGGTDVINVVLTVQPASNVVLAVTSADPTEVTVAPAQLTFTPGNWSVAQAVTVTGVDDSDVDGDQTTTVTVSVVAGASDDAYDAVPAQTVTVTNTDDDATGFTVSETGGSTVVSEDGGTDELTVVLTAAPASSVVLNVTSADATEVTVSPSRLTFTPGSWSTAQVVTVRGVDDDFVDGDQVTTVTVAVDAAASDDAYDGAAPQTASVTTTDDDVAGLSVVETDGSSVVTEDGGSDEILVALSAGPLAPVSLAVSSSDPSEVVASPSLLTFTSADWSESQVITLRGVDDEEVDGPQVSTVTLSVVAPFSGGAYDDVPDRTVSVTTLDDDGPDAGGDDGDDDDDSDDDG
jgi:hypothetical protein